MDTRCSTAAFTDSDRPRRSEWPVRDPPVRSPDCTSPLTMRTTALFRTSAESFKQLWVRLATHSQTSGCMSMAGSWRRRASNMCRLSVASSPAQCVGRPETYRPSSRAFKQRNGNRVVRSQSVSASRTRGIFGRAAVYRAVPAMVVRVHAGEATKLALSIL